MKLALLGNPIAHSMSPEIYKRLLGRELESYELLDIDDSRQVPTLLELAKNLDGLSITSPYKKHFIGQVDIQNDEVKNLGIINTISFSTKTPRATNTDLIAIKKILERFQKEHKKLQLILLGNGAMASLTKSLSDKLGLPLLQMSRSSGLNLSMLDLSVHHQRGIQTIVINSCARSFIFEGKIHPDYIFWDYNYRFLPHANSLPGLVKTYIDGEEMLELQAQAAIDFWSKN